MVVCTIDLHAQGEEKRRTKLAGAVATHQRLNHILQQWYSTHYHRINRHNSLVQYLNRTRTARNYTVHVEPSFTIDNSTKFNLDLVIYSPDRVILVDLQVVNDQFPLQTAHPNMIQKYEVLRQQLQGLRSGGFHGSTLTLNWRVVVAERSYKEILALGFAPQG